MNDTAQTLIRSVLKVGAGMLVAKGLADQSTAEAITGGVIAIIGVIWGVLHKKQPA